MATAPGAVRVTDGADGLNGSHHEAFGEALACGTPVVARAEGAAPEIVDHGKVGFLGRTDAELEAGVHDVDRIDRLTCRTWAAQRFSLELMAKRYEEQYLLAVEGRAAA